jgi:hypothetical protein
MIGEGGKIFGGMDSCSNMIGARMKFFFGIVMLERDWPEELNFEPHSGQYKHIIPVLIGERWKILVE